MKQLRHLTHEERFVPTQREKAAALQCPRCGAAPHQPCIYERTDRAGQPATILHIERYPTHEEVA